MYSAEKQVGGITNCGLYTVARREGTDHVANRQGYRIFEPSFTEVAQRVRRSPLCDSQ